MPRNSVPSIGSSTWHHLAVCLVHLGKVQNPGNSGVVSVSLNSLQAGVTGPSLGPGVMSGWVSPGRPSPSTPALAPRHIPASGSGIVGVPSSSPSARGRFQDRSKQNPPKSFEHT